MEYSLQRNVLDMNDSASLIIVALAALMVGFTMGLAVTIASNAASPLFAALGPAPMPLHVVERLALKAEEIENAQA